MVKYKDVNFPKFLICLPYYNFGQEGFYFHKHVKVVYPTLDELRARNSDIGSDLIVKLQIEKPDDCIALDVFNIGEYILFSERSLTKLNQEFEHTIVDVKIESKNQDILNKNYARLFIDREYHVVDMDKSDFTENKYGNIVVRFPMKISLFKNCENYRGMFSDPHFPGVYFCDFEFARRFVVEELSGLQFFHPTTHPSSKENLVWLSNRGLERNLDWDGKSAKVDSEVILSF